MTAQLAVAAPTDFVVAPLPPRAAIRPANAGDAVSTSDSRPPAAPPVLLDRVRQILRERHYSARTESAYIEWIHRFFAFFPGRDPESVGEVELRAYLGNLASRRDVTAAARSQARAALLLLFHGVLSKRVNCTEALVRPKAGGPVAISRAEIARLLAAVEPGTALVAALLYGSGLRPAEVLLLRVRDLDFDAGIIYIRDTRDRVRAGQAGKAMRGAILPAALVEPLRQHLDRLRALHQRDLGRGTLVSTVPDAARVQDPGARRSFEWQWLFPAARSERDPLTGDGRRPHLHEAVLQRGLQGAARAIGVTQPINTHTLRHCFTVHLLENGVDQATVQAIIGVTSGPCPLLAPTSSAKLRSPMDV